MTEEPGVPAPIDRAREAVAEEPAADDAAIHEGDRNSAAETGAASEADASGAAAESDASGAPAAADAPQRFARFRGMLRLPRSRRGILALLILFGAAGGALVFGSATVIAWTETADFCGRCHQMGPELQAYQAGAHADVACAECHVEPGVAGWVKAKINGTKQLVQVITGLYPKPVPPPDHEMLPSVKDTCERCHSLDRLATTGVRTKTVFATDENNTRQFVGLLIRPGGGDTQDVERSVHWHVVQNVSFVSEDANEQTIDYIRVDRTDGTTEEYVALSQVAIPSDVTPDLTRIKNGNTMRGMDCLTCHNRVGHPIPSPRGGIDEDMTTGVLDATLPYLKREAMNRLTADYPDQATADAAIDALRDFYTQQYPTIAQAKAVQIDAAIVELKRLYLKTATPDMKVSAKTYPDNLGHMDSVGCFRCHDGAHYQVVDGAITTKTIPSTCDTCHTFPQIGQATASLPFGAPPATHQDKLYVFNHRTVANSIDPGGQTCGECHARDFCANCHDTGAINIDHDQMLYNHADTAKTNGTTSCAYCHQPIQCSRCHDQTVLPAGGGLGGPLTPNNTAAPGASASPGLYPTESPGLYPTASSSATPSPAALPTPGLPTPSSGSTPTALPTPGVPAPTETDEP